VAGEKTRAITASLGEKRGILTYDVTMGKRRIRVNLHAIQRGEKGAGCLTLFSGDQRSLKRTINDVGGERKER